jgi:hypothetical protein
MTQYLFCPYAKLGCDIYKEYQEQPKIDLNGESTKINKGFVIEKIMFAPEEPVLNYQCICKVELQKPNECSHIELLNKLSKIEHKFKTD